MNNLVIRMLRMAGKYNNIMITFDERGKSYNATYAISNSTYVDFRNYALMRGTGRYLKEVAPTSNYANKIFLATGLNYNVSPNNNTRYFFVEGTTEFLYFYNYNGPHWDSGNAETATKERFKYLTENTATSFQPELGNSGHGKWMDPMNWGFPDNHSFADNYWSDGSIQHITFSIAVSDYPVTGISNKSPFLYTDLTDAVLTSPHISIILQHIAKFRPHINDRTKLHDINFVRTTAGLGPNINITELRNNLNAPRETLSSLSARYTEAYSTGTDRYGYIKSKMDALNAAIDI